MSKGGKRSGAGKPAMGERKAILVRVPVEYVAAIHGKRTAWICEAIRQRIERESIYGHK